jgi:hypothetical protein
MVLALNALILVSKRINQRSLDYFCVGPAALQPIWRRRASSASTSADASNNIEICLS